MKKRLAIYCAAALMLAALVTPYASLAPVGGYAAQDRGRPRDADKAPPKKDKDDGELITKKKFCEDCRKEHWRECDNNSEHARGCKLLLDSCNRPCVNMTGQMAQTCRENCQTKYEKCRKQCLEDKCKEQCEGVEEAPPEED